MPGRSVNEAIESFLEPLQQAVACLGTAHITLSPGARGDVGEPHSWTLNGGGPLEFGDAYALDASMHFEVQDRGKSLGRERFKVSTRAYLYAIQSGPQELMAAHWHPEGSSPVTFPHWHFGGVALSDSGVFLERAHIPSPRVTLEYMVRFALESCPGATATCDDWAERLARTEDIFDQHKTWSDWRSSGAS